MRRAQHAGSTAAAAAGASGSSSGQEEAWGDGLYACPAFKANGGVLSISNFFSQVDFSAVVADCEALAKRAQPERNSLAKGRMIAAVPQGGTIAGAVLSEAVCTRVGRKVGRQLLAGDYPVELRIYRPGSYMEWHVDDVMYSEPQYEMIYTVTNTTDSLTQWIDASGATVSHWPEPNSLICVRAGGALHQVTRVGRGERIIIKFILTPTLEKGAMFHEYLTTLNPFA
ncbi:hypothetical protein FOA52_013579 [Chlamydomonas sp. UWO 241]|nr:hypothetical protein FOA52_013579 [Chlamydomonas sp. UWO 241]